MSTYEELFIFCTTHCFNETTANYSICTETHFVDCALYPKSILDLEYLVPVTLFLVVIFLTGILGNLSVCVVILKHPSMRSETNVYLFSLAISDILLLLFGLVPELRYYWQTYPYVLGEFTCRLTAFLAATATWASALTVVAFSIERYSAICHHSRFRTKDRKRVAIALLAIWTISVSIALPALHVYHVVTNDQVVYPGTGEISLLSRVCTVPNVEEYKYYDKLYSATCVLFFFIPMAILMLVYTKIALFISKHRKQVRSNGIKSNSSEDNKIFKVLVAVVLAFFVCGAPFHYQRLSILSEDSSVLQPSTAVTLLGFKNMDFFKQLFSREDDQDYQTMLFVITALFYYLSATVNPILYNAMSKRYRNAFKDVMSRTRRQSDFPMTTVAEARESTRKYNSNNKTIADSYSSIGDLLSDGVVPQFTMGNTLYE